MDYDPAVIDYEELLGLFWASHDPAGRSWSTQYKAVAFFHDAGQEAALRASVTRLEAQLGGTVGTELLPFGGFTRAEDYHQKYRLRAAKDLAAAVRAEFPSDREFAESTVAARLNAHLAGHLTLAALRTELDPLGWTVIGATRLESVRRNP